MLRTKYETVEHHYSDGSMSVFVVIRMPEGTQVVNAAYADDQEDPTFALKTPLAQNAETLKTHLGEVFWAHVVDQPDFEKNLHDAIDRVFVGSE